MVGSKHGFLSEQEREEFEEDELRKRRAVEAARKRKQDEEAQVITAIVKSAADEVDRLAAEIDGAVRDILTDFVTASSRQIPTIEKTEFCPNDEIDDRKPWLRYEKVHRWHAEYEAAHMYAELHSMTTNKPLPLIGAFSGLQLRCVIKWGKTIPIVNLHRLDDVFEARLGIPAILEVEYESEDPAHRGSSMFRYTGP
jgi:hypothetical protein